MAGTAERSNGALTIVALAQEAGVPRNALTQRHPDLKNEFYEKVRERGGTPEAETRLRRQIVELKEARARDRNEIKQLKLDVQGLVQALNQSTLENLQLRETLARPAGRSARCRYDPLPTAPDRPEPRCRPTEMPLPIALMVVLKPVKSRMNVIGPGSGRHTKEAKSSTR